MEEKTLKSAPGSYAPRLARAQRLNCIRRHGRQKVEFEHVKFAREDRKRESEKGTADRDSEREVAANISAGGGARQSEVVSYGETGRKEQSKGDLNGVVFFGVKVGAAEIVWGGG